MIRSVLIEIRPGLRTSLVCIVLKEGLTDAEVKIRNKAIVLFISNEEITIPFNDFEIEPMTLTCFRAVKQCISFRVDVASCPKIEQKPKMKRVLPVNMNEVTKLSCKCGCPITDDVIFKRVLPLPSNGLDFADMFCNFDKHMSVSLQPRLNDCLYHHHYISVNKELLRNVKVSSFVKCRRCFATLGHCKNDSVQLWNTSLVLPNENLTPVDEFKRIVKKAVEESFMIFLKIFLECVESKNGLLISVVDKQLFISRSGEDLKLKTENVLKIKYEYHRSVSNLRERLEKENVQCIEVSNVVLNEGLQFLVNTTESMPPMFRTVDGEFMAYLEIS